MVNRTLAQQGVEAKIVEDQSVLDYQQMVTLPQAEEDQKQSVRNWVDGNKPLVRSESIPFLNTEDNDDYITLKGEGLDSGVMEAMLERSIKHIPRISKLVRQNDSLLEIDN